MKVIKKTGQKYPSNVNRVTGEYQIRTVAGNQRNRSPIEASSQNMRRSPNRIDEQLNSDSAFEEMIVDPNEANFRRGQNMSPLNDSHNNMVTPSPNEGNRNDYTSGGIVNMTQRMNFLRHPRYQQNNMDDRKETSSRSPKTINVGESAQDMEYNIKTFNKRNNNLNMMNSPQNNFIGDRSYNMNLNETGNIFLDQPMQQAYNQQNEQFNFGLNDPRNVTIDQNSREMQFGMNPRDMQEPMIGVLRKMSPKGNVEGDSDSNSEKYDNVNQITDLKSQLDRNGHVMFKNEDGIGIGDRNRQNRGDIENIRLMAKSRDFQDNATGDEVKKLIKYYVKTYDPHKGEDGNLISNSQTVILSNQAQLFNDRYKVLQKMNKLSNILLSKNRTGSPESATLNRSFGEDGKNQLDIGTLNKTGIVDVKKTYRKPRRNKFLYVSLAMLSAKGPNTEDRTILRRMRLDKGGVVDLAQETLQKKSKFKIKKARAGGRGITTINPKYREKAAKIVQAWWRERKEKYKRILEQIIKIQSVWRGKFTRKYIYDVIYISYLQEKFLSIMRKVLVNHIRPYVFDKLFSKKKLIRDILGDLLSRNDKRFTYLRIRPYFLKWKNNSDLLSERNLKCRELFDKKEEKENKKNILRNYFDKWVTMKNLYKYIGQAKNADEKRKKFFGAMNMVNGLNSLSKRQVFKNTKGPISNYLKDLLKQKILIKIFKTICKKCLKTKLQNYLNKWRIAAIRIKLEELKKEVFLNIIKHTDSRLNKIKMKYYLDKWRRHIPKYTQLFKIKDGFEILNKLATKKNIKYPINAFNQKINEINRKDALSKLLLIKARKLKDELRDKFNKWKNKKIRLDDKDKRNEIYKNLLKNLINKINKRILQKRFNQWRARPKVDVTGEMKKINDFTNILKNVIKNHYNDNFKSFLDKLNKTRAPRSLNKAANKLFKIFNNNRKIILRYYLYRWRSQTKNDELKELHRQLLRYLITSLQAKNNRNTLGKYLARWRLFVGDNQNYDNIDKLKLVLKGGDLLDNLYKRRIRDLINRLYMKLGKDYRPIFLGKLIKNLDKPRSTLREIFNRWKGKVDKDKAITNITKYKAKIITTNVNTVKKRSDRDNLMRAFFHWRAMSKKPEEYYPRVNNLLNALEKYIKKKAVSEPFDLIKITRNPTRHLLKLVKNYDNQEKRLLDGKLRNLLGRWRKAASDTGAKDLKARILYNIKVYLDEAQKKKLLSKYLTQWKLNCRKKGLDVNFGKGIDKLTEIFKAPNRKIVYDAYINKIKDTLKQKGANDLLKVLNNQKNKLLKNILMEWWKKVATTDPNRMTKIKTKIRKIIKYNEMEPRTKAFKKWVKTVRALKLKDKDLYHAKRIIGGQLRSNDKMNLYNALNRWRNQVYLLKEEYLKALLIKQIKNAQNAKERMSNEARLRTALLKWRTNLISMNYLDNIKNIRKGCKLLKLGLKKMHEGDILDNLKDLSKLNSQKTILNKIVSETIPNLAIKKMKTFFDVWRSKIGDTQKMTNKLTDLLEDYIYTDRVHSALFKQPKEDLINLAKVYNDKRKEAAQKISNFVKGIKKISEYNKTMRKYKLLDNIIKFNDKIYDKIKKMYLRRFYRQAHKDKINENVTLIQKFIKKKLKRLFDKNKIIEKGLEKLEPLVKKVAFDRIKNKSKSKKTVIIIKKIIHTKGDKNKDKLRNAFNEWRNKIPHLRKLAAAITIQNAVRNHNANKKLDNLKQRIVLLKKIHEKYEKDNKNKLRSLLRDWIIRSLMIKNNEGAKTIQRIYRKMAKIHKKNAAIDNLKNLFKKYTIRRLTNGMEKISRVMGGKGLLVYKTIEDILYRGPFNKLINNLKTIRRVNALKKIQPKVHEQLKKYYLPKALKKWKENTYDQTNKHTLSLQKFLRDQYEKKKKRDKEKRELILNEIVNRKIKNDLYKLKLPFNIWYKKVMLEKMNEAATKIQNKFRQSLSKEKVEDTKAINKYLKLVELLKNKTLVDVLKQVKNDKSTKDNIKKILTKILSKKIFVNDKANLENSFNKWKRYNQLTKDYATRIANAFRIYKAKKKKDRLKNIKDLLKKYVLKHEKTDNDTLRSKLRKWKNKTKLEKLNEKAIVIQKLMKPLIAKIINDKFKKYFNDNAKKRVHRLLLLVGKVNKLQKAIHRPSVHKFKNNITKIRNDKTKTLSLKKAVRDIDNKIRTLKLRKFLQRWKDKSKKLGEKTNDSASIIQRAFKGYKARKERDRLMRIKNLLFKLTLHKDDIINNKLYITLRKWVAIAKNMTFNENASKIQKYWKKFQNKLKNDKELARKLKIQNGLEKLLDIKFGARYAIDKLISEKNRNIFTKFNDDLKQKRLDTLKNCFDKIKKRGNDNVLKTLIKIPDAFRKRILKKYLLTLRDKTDKLAKKRAADTIIKNWRIYINKKRQYNKRGSLEKILGHVILKNSNVLRNCFRRWNDIAKKMIDQQNKSRIARFINNRYRIVNARNNWKKLVDKYMLKDRNGNLFDFINKLKKYIVLNRLKKPLTNLAQRQFFDKLKNDKKKVIRHTTIIKIITERNQNNNNNILNNYFLKWRDNVDKLIDRDERFRNALDLITLKQTINDVDNINRAMTLKKLLHDIPLVRAKFFLDKIKEISDRKNKYSRLGEDIIKAKNDLDTQKKIQLLDKIYKLYYLNKINELIKACNKYDRRLRPIYGKDFLNKLYKLKSKFSTYKYKNKQEATNKAKITNLSFKNKVRKNYDVISDPKAPMMKVLPSMVKYLQNLINRRNGKTFDKLISDMKSKSFANLFKKYNNKTIQPAEKEFVQKIRRDAKYSETRPTYQVKLFKLFRKKYIRYVRTVLVEPSRLYRLFYLLNMTKMHTNIAAQRYYREIIRKWRFISFTKKMARKKMELMYKNLHASYLQMADDIFGEDKVNPSVWKEFERFGSNVGMFTGQEKEIEEELNKKYYSTIDKKYTFTNRASGVINDAQVLKNEEYVEKMIEGYEEVKPKPIITFKRSNTLNPKSINEHFDNIKKSGKYYSKDK